MARYPHVAYKTHENEQHLGVSFGKIDAGLAWSLCC